MHVKPEHNPTKRSYRRPGGARQTYAHILKTQYFTLPVYLVQHAVGVHHVEKCVCVRTRFTLTQTGRTQGKIR